MGRLPPASRGGRSSAGRAPGCGPGGRGFESHRSPFTKVLQMDIFAVEAARRTIGPGYQWGTKLWGVDPERPTERASADADRLPCKLAGHSASTAAWRGGDVGGADCASAPRCLIAVRAPRTFAPGARRFGRPARGPDWSVDLTADSSQDLTQDSESGCGPRATCPYGLFWPSTSRPQRRVCEVKNQTRMDRGWGCVERLRRGTNPTGIES